MEQDKAALGTLQASIDEISEKLCLAVQGEFDFTIDIQTQDESVQKLTMLVNFVLDAARRSILEVREKNAKLTELDKLKSEFIANISHELRTPLTLILGPLETILARQEAEFSEETMENLKRIQRNALRLYALVNDVLDFSKLEAGKFIINEESLDLNQLISQLVEDAQGLARERKISLEFIDSPNSSYVLVDRKITEKIILNLISNALKFTPPSGKITVQLTRENSLLCLSVSDTGIGIPATQLPMIFDRFRQIDSSSTRAHPGTGLGLALINQFVTLLNGKILVESEEGRGTKFQILIPEKNSTTDSPQPAVDATKSNVTELETPLSLVGIKSRESYKADVKLIEPSGDKPLILITDDNPDILAYVSSFLKDSFAIITASNGKLALEAAKQYLPLVILSDVMMPQMDGYQLTQALKTDALTQHIPIILITAKTGTEAIVSSLEVGADDYLSKPFSAEELIARTHSALRHHQEYLKNCELNDQLVTVARRAGMADIATSILHNVGNVLNSVNVSIGMIQENTNKPHVKNLSKITGMIEENEGNLVSYFTQDEKGKVLPQYLAALAKEVNDEYISIDNEVQRLNNQVKHIESIVAMQQSISGGSGCHEKIFLPDVINTAILMCKSSIEKRNISITKEIKENIFLVTDKNQLLQIILNLIQNANDALSLPQVHAENRIIMIMIEKNLSSNSVDIKVSDNGVGIDQADLNKIFTFGFTTKPQGHGFGLHSSALVARELGGSLRASSEGSGYGAEFILTLPLGLGHKN